MNSYKHSHISGVLLSLNDNGGDYFLLAHTVRNVCEWIASQATLPNNLELPCHLPLPIPAFNVDNPLQLNTTTGKYFQPNRNPILYIEKHRNKSSRCIEARNKVTSTNIFSPPLLEQIVHGTEVQTYRVDAVGMVFMSLSDGAPAISAGLGAAFSSMDQIHIECWSHLHPIAIKNQFSLSSSLNLQIPDSAVSHIANSNDRSKEKRKLKKSVMDYTTNYLNLIRDTISSALASLMFSHLCNVLKTGYSSRSVRIALPVFAEKISNRYSRLTVNGSFGVWRKSDVCDLSLEQFDEESGEIVDRIQRISSFVSGVPATQSSIESFNGLTKQSMERKPKEVVELMSFFSTFIVESVMIDYQKYGFSYSSLPYGTGTGNNRNKSTKHRESILLGMTFLGFSTYRDFIFDQRLIYSTDISFALVF